MNKELLEKKLHALISSRFTGGISGAVQLGQSVRTFEQWDKAGYNIKKGQKGFPVKVGDKTRFYFWWTQVWNVKKYRVWKENQNKFNHGVTA